MEVGVKLSSSLCSLSPFARLPLITEVSIPSCITFSRRSSLHAHFEGEKRNLSFSSFPHQPSRTSAVFLCFITTTISTRRDLHNKQNELCHLGAGLRVKLKRQLARMRGGTAAFVPAASHFYSCPLFVSLPRGAELQGFPGSWEVPSSELGLR